MYEFSLLLSLVTSFNNNNVFSNIMCNFMPVLTYTDLYWFMVDIK